MDSPNPEIGIVKVNLDALEGHLPLELFVSLNFLLAFWDELSNLGGICSVLLYVQLF